MTYLADPTPKSADSDSGTSLDNLSKSIFGLNKDDASNTDAKNDSNDSIDASLLDQNIINALEDNSIRIYLDTDNVVTDNEEECVSVGISNVETSKLNKTIVHPSAVKDVIEEGNEKMKKINLPVVRHRRLKRLAREKKAIRDNIYQSLVNSNNSGPIDTIIE